MLAQGLDVEAVVVDHGTVALDHGDHLRVVLGREEVRGVIADIAETLHDDALAAELALEARLLHFLRVAEELAQGVLHAAAGGLVASAHPAVLDRLAGDAAHVVDVVGEDLAVGVDHPAHLARAGAHVRRRHVLRRAEVALVDQLARETARDRLHLVAVVLARIDDQAALGAAEGHVDDGALVGHQRRQRLDLVLVDAHREADAALRRQAVIAVHRAPAGEDLGRAVDLHGKGYLQHGGAGLQRVAHAFLELHDLDRVIDHPVDASPEFDSTHGLFSLLLFLWGSGRLLR